MSEDETEGYEITPLCGFDGDAADIASIVQDPDTFEHMVGVISPGDGGWALTPDQAVDLATRLLMYAKESRECDAERGGMVP
jgi:hypothetical protein